MTKVRAGVLALMVVALAIVLVAVPQQAEAQKPMVSTLTWNASPSQGVIGYNVYRGGTKGGPYTKLALSPIAGLTCDDTNVARGNTYYYVVTAITTNDESGYSNEAIGVIPQAPNPAGSLATNVHPAP